MGVMGVRVGVWRIRGCGWVKEEEGRQRRQRRVFMPPMGARGEEQGRSTCKREVKPLEKGTQALTEYKEACESEGSNALLLLTVEAIRPGDQMIRCSRSAPARSHGQRSHHHLENSAAIQSCPQRPTAAAHCRRPQAT